MPILQLLAKLLHSLFKSQRQLALEIRVLTSQCLPLKEFSYQVRYNSVTMKREKTANLFRSAYSVIAAVMVLLGELLRTVLSLLASSAETQEKKEDQFDGAFKVGSYNYWTRQFDDGTDPIGWYSNE